MLVLLTRSEGSKVLMGGGGGGEYSYFARPEGEGSREGKIPGAEPVWGPEILVKHLFMGATVKRVGGL